MQIAVLKKKTQESSELNEPRHQKLLNRYTSPGLSQHPRPPGAGGLLSLPSHESKVGRAATRHSKCLYEMHLSAFATFLDEV